MPQSVTASPTLKHLTAGQLAERLVITEDYLRRSLLGQSDGIPGIKLGTGPRAQWRIRLCDVEKWEESRLVCYDAAPQRPNTR